MFRLRKDADEWFCDIRPKLATDFDVYYICLMAGLSARRKEEAQLSQVRDLTDTFPSDYRAVSSIIVSLFLSRELKQLGVKVTERNAVHTAIGPLIERRSSTLLSDLGTKELNKYACAGYDVLMEWFGHRPRTLETFLPVYKQKLSESLDSPN